MTEPDVAGQIGKLLFDFGQLLSLFGECRRDVAEIPLRQRLLLFVGTLIAAVRRIASCLQAFERTVMPSSEVASGGRRSACAFVLRDLLDRDRDRFAIGQLQRSAGISQLMRGLVCLPADGPAPLSSCPGC